MISYWVVLKIILIVIGFILMYSFLQFLVNIHPPRYYDPATPGNYGLKYENISFITSDKIKIKAWLIASEKANGTIIIGHGYPFNKGNILHVVKFLHPTYNLLLYDHRYFGESEGKITTAGLYETRDVKAAINFTQKRFPGKPIALYGFSLSASAMLMTKSKINAIIADSPYADLNKMIKHIYSIFGPLKFPFVITTNLLAKIFFGKWPKDISPALAVRDYDVPIFIIHGEKDSQIPVENAYALKENNPNIEFWIVEGADHGQVYAFHPKKYKTKIKSFLRKHMK